MPVQGAPEANNAGWMGFETITTVADKFVSRGLPPAYHLPLSVTATVLEQVTAVVNQALAPVVTGLKPLEDGKFELTFSPAIALNANNLPSGISVRGTEDLSSWRDVQVLSGKTNSVVFSAKDSAGNIPDKAFYQLIKK